MKYHKLVENAKKPDGFWGKLMIRSMNKGHSALTDWALEYIEINKSDYVLDVGCGGGKTLAKLSDKIGNGKAFGIDYSELCVKKSSKANQKNILCGKTAVYQASVDELPFEDNIFNLVTAVETYYFWPDKLAGLQEIYRTLKSGGKILLVFEMLKTPDKPNKWKFVEQQLNIEAVSRNEITDILLRAGYQNIRTHIKNGTSWLCAVAEKE